MPTKKPQITQVLPAVAIPGGEFQIRGSGLAGADRPRVLFGDTVAPILVGSDTLVIARVPEGAGMGPMVVEADSERSSPWMCEIGIQMADALHPVASPAVDRQVARQRRSRLRRRLDASPAVRLEGE